MSLLLGIDLGTTGCKASIYDPASGRCLGEAYLEYGLITLSPVMIEQDPHAWWQLTCRAVRLALDAAGVPGAAIGAVAASSQGISFVLLDEAGQPIGNAINWLDGRAVAESEEVLQRYGAAELFRLTGKRAAPFYVLPKLLWLRGRRPDAWARARKVLMAHDYLVYRMCGVQVTDHSMAGGTLLYDLRERGWSCRLLQDLEISPDLLPEIAWSGTPVGTLRPDAAAELGLRPETVVCAGGQDQKCAALGAGIDDRSATVSLGTASAVVQLMPRPTTDPAMRVPTFAFVSPDRWVLEGVISTGAGSLRWYRDTVAAGASYAALDAEAEAAPRGAGGVAFYPHLTGAGSPFWDSSARAAFAGISLATTRAHLTRAVLEGVAFEIRHNLAVTQDIGGPVERVILFGGGARSALWRAIIGDVLGCRLAWTRTVETAGLGAAMLAGTGCGLFASLAEARRALVGQLALRDPDPQAAAEYAGSYAAYCRAESALLGRPVEATANP